MQNFNQSISKISNSEYINIEDDESTTFFDGIAGSKPLDMNKILDNTQNKLRMLESMKVNIQEFKADIVEVVNQDFVQEKINTKSRVVLKDVNFGKESLDFNSSKINVISGSIAATQANTTQVQIVKLLSN